MVCVCVWGGGGEGERGEGGVEKCEKVSTVYYDVHYSQAPPRFLLLAVQYM